MELEQEMAGISEADKFDEQNVRAVLKKQEAIRTKTIIIDIKMMIYVPGFYLCIFLSRLLYCMASAI